MSYSLIETTLLDGMMTVRLARPPVNVLNAQMMSEIGAALDQAEGSESVRAVVLKGQGTRIFSAGVEVADHTPDRVGESIEEFSALLRKFQNFPLPTIAALNGSALGGGFELAAACHMMVARPDAKLGHPEIKLASVAFFGILLLQRRLPSNVIVELLASGEPMTATEAHRLGLINKLFPVETFDADVDRFAARFASMSRPVLALLMKTLRLAQGKDLASGVGPASEVYLNELLPLEDVTEGLAAFAEKRPPAWKHR